MPAVLDDPIETVVPEIEDIPPELPNEEEVPTPIIPEQVEDGPRTRSLIHALNRLDHGRCWGQGHYEFEDKFCAVGALRITGSSSWTLGISALTYLADAIAPKDRCASGDAVVAVVDFNDHAHRTWEEIEAVFLRAIDLARKDRA